VSSRIAHNLRSVRTGQGVSTYALADRLKPEEWQITREGVVEYGVALIGDVRVDTRDAWAWACGEKPLVLRDKDWKPLNEPTGVDEAMFQVANQPHHYVGGYATMPVDVFGALGRMIRQCLDDGMPAAQLREFFSRAITAAVGDSGDGES